MPPLDQSLQNRSDYPDIRNNALVYEPDEPYGQAKPGTVAARDLYVFHQLLAAELALAARELNPEQVDMIVDALRGVGFDFTWVTGSAGLLSMCVIDNYADDEDGPDEDREALAGLIAAWPPTRAYAVVEAASVAWKRAVTSEPQRPLAETLAEAGLLRARRTR
ncbi:hypothetical protein ACFVHW_04145 [Streptomyces sp. NPDC127110]|uniref:hypothetical protein n=1 Tax=Streptomyces sp. NPDC127110 TaxID=3345362 RepID=UPI00363867A9